MRKYGHRYTNGAHKEEERQGHKVEKRKRTWRWKKGKGHSRRNMEDDKEWHRGLVRREERARKERVALNTSFAKIWHWA
jgi:hypothetical protein